VERSPFAKTIAECTFSSFGEHTAEEVDELEAELSAAEEDALLWALSWSPPPSHFFVEAVATECARAFLLALRWCGCAPSEGEEERSAGEESANRLTAAVTWSE
jgi:hypothetical protein